MPRQHQLSVVDVHQKVDALSTVEGGTALEADTVQDGLTCDVSAFRQPPCINEYRSIAALIDSQYSMSIK